MIYCGYQGCGKSTHCKAHPDTTVDLDSSLFVKSDYWYEDYVKVAHEISKTGKDVFISAHQVVINRLIELGIEYELIIPLQNARAWRARLEFRYNVKPIQSNLNALIDFDKNFEKDMTFYDGLKCKKHYVSATITTNIEEKLRG